ncbi:hypothetical protein DW145_09695 [Bifidobacterium bifidum]|uniref:Uncharacterized protein n=1 Tax=Bifidobacterium bifidum TaxID=1681 RepID=A0A415C2Z7_BIFBI|nr:hypothetical protein DXD34_09470 [Bifidobacterium bifidum]RHA93724.1 hypothetical protein DW909_08575 [Bifidobacterium bifidum]RHJ03184.1 hypothetical protein DW145_09695 [Bifidobacterium bifidum]RHJ22062.1 hypothetical protein DW137_09550 [Bifidobacterium bifidum]
MIHEDRWKSTSEALDRLADERHGKDDDEGHGKLSERLDGVRADCDASDAGSTRWPRTRKAEA